MSSAKIDKAQIARLLKPYAALSDEQLTKTGVYLDLLLKWNARMNLTGLREPEQMVTRHFGESFFAASRLIEPGWQGSVIDVGSGAGFPGIPMAIWSPKAEVTLIESNGRKAAFLNEVGRALELGNIRVVSQRAELFEGQAELVTMRAVERFEESLPVALRLVLEGGRIALMIGKEQVARAQQAAAELNWNQPISLPGGHSRMLLAGTKTGKGGTMD